MLVNVIVGLERRACALPWVAPFYHATLDHAAITLLFGARGSVRNHDVQEGPWPMACAPPLRLASCASGTPCGDPLPLPVDFSSFEAPGPGTPRYVPWRIRVAGGWQAMLQEGIQALATSPLKGI